MSRNAPRGASVVDRLRFHTIVAPSGCWVWTGYRDEGSGYGRMQVDKRCHYAHRVSYEAFVGPLLPGLQVDHLCRNRRCVNPEHLQQVTPQTNILRGQSPGAVAQRRVKCRQGHPFAEHGVVRAGRRVCRTCQIEYNRAYRAARAQTADRVSV